MCSGNDLRLHAEGRRVRGVNSEATSIVLGVVQRLRATTEVVGSFWFRSAIPCFL